MALKDCLKLLDKVTDADVALLEQYIAEGLTDKQAVRRLLIETNVDVINIADRARAQGAEVAVPKDAIADIRNFQDTRLRSLIKKRGKLEDEMEFLNVEYKILAYEAELFDQLLAQGKQLYDPVENMEESEILMRIGQVMFDENVRVQLSAGWHGFKGNGPREVLDSWNKHRQRRIDNRQGLGKLVGPWNEVKGQINEIIAGYKDPDTFFQEGGEVGTMLDESGNYPETAGERKDPKVREPTSDANQAQGDLFASPDLSSEEVRAEVVANYKIRVKHETTSEYNVGLETVKSAADAAHILAPVRRNAQENMVALVLDKDGKPLSVIHHAKGTIDGTGVYPSILAGAIHGTEGADSVWFGHNHPSGHNQPSQADERITKRLYQIMSGSGIKINGHVIIAAGGKANQMTDDGAPMGPIDITPARRNLRVPVTERILRAAPNDAPTLNSPSATVDMLKKSDSVEGVYLLDNRHRPLGVVSLSEEQMKQLRNTGGAAELFKAIDKTNAAAMILYTKDPMPEAMNNVAAFANISDVRMLDHIYGPDFKSRAKEQPVGFPPSGLTFYQKKRGSITFDEARRATINLFEASDASTFIHEAGHLYLELMGMLAERMDANEQILTDYQTILKHLGVKERSEIKRKHHELFARSFEKFAMDGKAPSMALQDAFNSFRRWLGEIYKRIAGVRDIELPQDIRDVMNRMLATDAEITLAESTQQFDALFTSAEQMGVSQELFDVYKRSLMRAHDEAVQNETVKVLAARRRDQKAWWKEAKAKVEEQVREEVYAMPIYKAWALLQHGKKPDGSPATRSVFKLSKQSLVDRYGEKWSQLKTLRKYDFYRVKGGVDVDEAALELGYRDGDALVEALLTAVPMEAAIEAETIRRMDGLYPDPFKDGSLAEVAVREVHSDRRANILAAEMRQLRALQRRDKPVVQATKKAEARETREAREANRGILPKRAEVAMIKEAARQAIGKRKYRDVSPNVYLNAERKAGRLAFEAATKGDFQKAFMHKRQQLMNHEMYRAAQRARERTDKTRTYLTKFESKRVQQRLGRSNVLDKILAVLEGVDFRKRSLTKVDQKRIEDELSSAIQDMELLLPEGVLDRIFDDKVNWQDLTIDELDAMRDLIKQLEAQARAEVQAIVNGEKVDLDNAGKEVAAQVYENNKIIDMGVGEQSKWGKTKSSAKGGVFAWLRPSSIARVLDGAGFGAVTRNVIVPMRRAYSERLIPNLHKALSDVSKLYSAHYDFADLRVFHKKRFRIDSLGETVSRSDIVSLALNWGNEGNRRAVLAGEKRDGTAAYSEAAVRQMLAHMTESDWAFVQDVWDYLETYWPDIRDAEQRRRGVAPKQVEALPFTVRTADGAEVNLRGGYYPLKYASEHSDQVEINEYEDQMKKVQNSFHVATSTRAGATYERTRQRGRVVRLSLNVLDNHLREIIRDIAIGDEVNYLKRLMAQKQVRDAFHRTGNGEALNTMDLWLTDAAVGELPAEGFWEHSTAFIRTGFTKAKLGWNLMTTALQFTGFTQSMAVIGSKNMAIGLGKLMKNPAVVWRHTMDRSAFLNTRYNVGAWDKDVQDTKAHLDSFFGAAPTRSKVMISRLSHTYFMPIAKAQQVVDITTWLGSYDKARNELRLDDNDAVLYADSQVEAAQTSGFFSDRSGLERGTLGKKKNRQSQYIRIWTTLISYMLAKGNLAYEKGKSTNYRKPSEVAALLTDLVLLYVVEGMASALLYSSLPESDEPEDVIWWAAKETGLSVLSGVPFVREVPQSRFAGGNTPLGSFAHDLFTLVTQAAEGEPDAAARKALYNVTGTAFHLPMGQLGRTLETIWFEDDPEFWEYISGVREK